MQNLMKALVYEKEKTINFIEKKIPEIQDTTDAIVKVKLSSICTSDLHIIHGFVPRARTGVVLGHEFVGEVVATGKDTKKLKIGDRVSANCETFCGECWFCKRGYVNNCINGGWELGCKIDGCQAEYVRVPYADKCLYKLPDKVSYKNALFVGDILASGYFGAELCEIKNGDTIAVIGAGPVGLCTMQCAKLFKPAHIIAIDIDDNRLNIAKNENLADMCINPNKDNVEAIIKNITQNRGADCVVEAAGTEDTFQMAWKIARPNAIVSIVAMYENSQCLPLPQMYGKNLTFKTGGVDAAHSEKLIKLIEKGKLNTDFLISETLEFKNILNGYKLFENKENGLLKIALKYD